MVAAGTSGISLANLRILWDNKSPFDQKYEIFGKKMGEYPQISPQGLSEISNP